MPGPASFKVSQEMSNRLVFQRKLMVTKDDQKINNPKTDRIREKLSFQKCYP
jgi:hypothetical protein